MKQIHKTKHKRTLVLHLLYPALALAFMLAIWFLAAYLYDLPLVLPSPQMTFVEFVRLFGQGQFWLAFAGSMARTVLSFLISCVLALFLALLGALFVPVARFLSPIITVIRAVPTISIIFLLILLTSPRTTPILVAAMIIMPTLYSAFTAAFSDIPRELIETGKVFGLNRFSQAVKIYLPCGYPQLFEASAGALTLSLKLIIAAEMLSQTANSLGFEMNIAKQSVEAGKLMALTLVTIFVCLLIEGCVRLIKKRFEFA